MRKKNNVGSNSALLLVGMTIGLCMAGLLRSISLFCPSSLENQEMAPQTQAHAVARGAQDTEDATLPAAHVFSMLQRLGSQLPLKEVYEMLVASYVPASDNDFTKPGVVIDVGLAHGDECFRTADLGLFCYGFEADPQSASAIQQKAMSHPHSHLLNITSAAVGDQSNAHVSFGTDVKNKFGVGGSLTLGRESTGKEYVKVPMVRLDDVFPDEQIFLLKTDTQGHELGVIRGAQKMIESRRVQFVLFEAAIFLMPRQTQDVVEILELLNENGYFCVDLQWHDDHNTFRYEGPIHSNTNAQAWAKMLVNAKRTNGTWGGYFTDCLCERAG